MNLWQKISAVMTEVEYLKKDDVVGKGSKSEYKAISEEKVTETVRVSFIKHGLVLLPVEQEHTCETRETENDYGKKGVSRLATVNVKYKLVDIETGEHEFIVSSGTGADSGDKAVGKAMTYAYKYALLRTLMIPTGEDPDKIASPVLDETKPSSRPNTPPPDKNAPQSQQTALSEKQLGSLYAIASSKGKTKEKVAAEVLKSFKVTPEQMSKANYDKTVKHYESLPDKKSEKRTTNEVKYDTVLDHQINTDYGDGY